jgi:hypothetical protein
MRGVQKTQDFPASFFSTPVLKDFDVHPGWILLAKMRGELDAAMDHVVVPDESPDKSDDDNGRTRGVI